MSDLKLSQPEFALLLILMIENRGLSNNEIGELYADSLKPKKPSWTKLNDAKVMQTDTNVKPFVHTLTDKGWHFLGERLGDAAGPRSGSYGLGLFAVLNGLGRYLDRTGRSLAQVFGGLPDTAPAAEAPAPVRASAPAADQIELSVRRAYRELARPAGSWVGLADLRERLVDVPRRDLDGVLRLMSRFPDVSLEEETNQKALTPRSREAAVRIGDRDQHALAIDAS
ncbi:hypothetical protein Val02_38810 [Virgisporangium aliadipatigenens]|uniref:Uncharacterized protein n=1 Tax=Virgisporangium aliadipatigenens TaxID=741659 RepID=A0A8J3YN92_9ACTN|nr:hypothetical protein [Virgisporangium aliadipatigenens]GIJ46995.1 hypothetical protein Val02_38810 [Virgisporangium aliadipatigenens]